MAKKFAVDFYFDVISPYSWIGFESLLRYSKEWPMAVALKPVNLGRVMKEAGNRPPAIACPAKMPYMGKDLARLSKYFGIPLRFPENFIGIMTTKSSVNSARVIIAVQEKQPEKAEDVARAMFARFWVHNKGIFERDDFLEVLSSCGVNDPESIVDGLKADAVQKRLMANSDEAIGLGCFGAPWTVVHTEGGKKESFFGSDRLHVIGHLMGKEFLGPLKQHSKI